MTCNKHTIAYQWVCVSKYWLCYFVKCKHDTSVVSHKKEKTQMRSIYNISLISSSQQWDECLYLFLENLNNFTNWAQVNQICLKSQYYWKFQHEFKHLLSKEFYFNLDSFNSFTLYLYNCLICFYFSFFEKQLTVKSPEPRNNRFWAKFLHSSVNLDWWMVTVLMRPSSVNPDGQKHYFFSQYLCNYLQKHKPPYQTLTEQDLFGDKESRRRIKTDKQKRRCGRMEKLKVPVVES